MKNTQSMKLNKDFRRLYYRGKSVVRSNIVVYVQQNRKKYNTLGLTCGKSIGKAVKRNRVKRLMRESYRLLEADINIGYDIVLVARSGAVSRKCVHILRDLRFAFNKLGLIKEDEKSSDNDG